MSTFFLLFLYLASYFSYFLLPCPGLFSLGVSSSVQQSSAYYSQKVLLIVLRVCFLSSYPASSRNSFVFICLNFVFFRTYSRVAFFVVFSYPVRCWHLIRSILTISRLWFFSHCLWPHNLYLSTSSIGWRIRKGTGGTADDKIMMLRLGGKNEDNNNTKQAQDTLLITINSTRQ